MSKDLDQKKDYGNISIKLEVEQQYNLGDFTLLLEETGELRVTIHKNRADMSIKPSSGNCVFISNLKKV